MGETKDDQHDRCKLCTQKAAREFFNLCGSLRPAHDAPGLPACSTLHYELEGEQQHVAHNWLDAELEARNLPATESGDGDGDEDAVEIATANGLWVLDEYAEGVSPSFLDLLAIHYDAGLKLAAFKDGVEAAAATGIGGDGDGDGDPDPPTVMVVDRPFLLAIRDRPTNTLLFFGRVLDPSL